MKYIVIAIALCLAAVAAINAQQLDPLNYSRPSPPPGTVPSILLNPSSQTSAVGSSVTFTVVAYGSANLIYQWYENGAPIASGMTYNCKDGWCQNRNDYTFMVRAADIGAQLKVVVSNPFGVATSAPFSISSTAAPSPPTNLTETVQ